MSDQAPKRPAKRAPRHRNGQADRDFIQAHVEELRVVDGQLVWTGRAEDIGSPYQLPPEEHRCSQRRRIRDDNGSSVLDADMEPLQQRCPKWVMPGAAICVDHANGSGAVKKAVQERLIGAADAIVGQLMGIAMSQAASDSDRIKAMNSLLDRAGIRGALEITPDIPGWQAVLQEMMGDTDGPSSA